MSPQIIFHFWEDSSWFSRALFSKNTLLTLRIIGDDYKITQIINPIKLWFLYDLSHIRETKQLLLMKIFVFSNKNMSKKSFKAPPSVGFLMGLYGLPQLGLKGKPLVSPLYLWSSNQSTPSCIDSSCMFNKMLRHNITQEETYAWPFLVCNSHWRNNEKTIQTMETEPWVVYGIFHKHNGSLKKRIRKCASIAYY